MPNETQMQQILRAAMRAPSGHNYQPWSFRRVGDALRIVFEPGKDTTVYNYDERGSFVGLGAATESICLCAQTLGFEAQYRFLYKRGSESRVAAEIVFRALNRVPMEYARSLFSRATNRKEYFAKTIEKEILTAILQTIDDIPSVRAYCITNQAERRAAAKALTVSDSLMLSHPAVRNAIFPHLIWTEQEEKNRREGMYIKTLELPTPAARVFRFFAMHPFFARVAGALGFGAIIAAQNTDRYAAGGVFVLLTIPDVSDRSFFELGRALQRIWTYATYKGLAAQPMGSLLFLAARAREEHPPLFSKHTCNRLCHAEAAIIQLFGVNAGEVPGIVLRIGYADPPSAISSRKEPVLHSDHI